MRLSPWEWPKVGRGTVKWQLKKIINYPPPYNWQVWDYKKADTTLIKKALSQVNWYFLFDKKDVNDQVKILNDTTTNVFSNFVPNKILTFDDRDPPWMSELIKQKIQWKNGIYKNYQNSSITKCNIRGIRVDLHCVKRLKIQSIFWSVFSRIRTEYWEILRISPYSVRMQENTD